MLSTARIDTKPSMRDHSRDLVRAKMIREGTSIIAAGRAALLCRDGWIVLAHIRQGVLQGLSFYQTAACATHKSHGRVYTSQRLVLR